MRVVGLIGGIVLLVACLGSIAFGLEWAGLEWEGYFAPKHEAVRREVFKETRSYVEAKEQELLKYRLEYLRSKDKVEKEALASTIRHAFAEFDGNKLSSPELQEFLRDMKFGR